MTESRLTPESFSERLRAVYSSAFEAPSREEKAFIEQICTIYPEEQLKNGPLLRRDAARILHVFLLLVLKEEDEDWGEYKQLKDIYDCRICANAIAQVCVKGLMRGVGKNVFGLGLALSEEEGEEIIKRVENRIG